MKRKRILIIGGSGFIGTNLINLYLKNDIEVLNIDFNEPKIKSHFEYWKNVDIRDYNVLKKIIYGFQPDFVIHLAARTDLDGENLTDYDTNTVGTQNIIKILNQIPSVKRVIFTSSMLVCKPGYIPKHPTDYATSTIYGDSKMSMEKIIRDSSHNYEWAIVRPTSIWGPWFGVPYRTFFDMVISKRYFHIDKNSCTKTYGYVENLIYQIDSILNAPTEKIQGNVFYLGDYESTNINNWANEMASEIGITIKTIPYPIMKLAAIGGDFLKLFGIHFPMTTFRLKNMTTDNVVDLSNTKEIVPNLPISRIEGIRKTLSWLKDNK